MIRLCLLLCSLSLLSSCTLRDPIQDEHTAKMFANIIITARAQRIEFTEQRNKAIETAALSGLDVMGEDLEDD